MGLTKEECAKRKAFVKDCAAEGYSLAATMRMYNREFGTHYYSKKSLKDLYR